MGCSSEAHKRPLSAGVKRSSTPSSARPEWAGVNNFAGSTALCKGFENAVSTVPGCGATPTLVLASTALIAD